MSSPEGAPSLCGLDQLYKAIDYFSDVPVLERALLVQPAIIERTALQRLQSCGLGLATLVLDDGREAQVTYVIDETTPEMRTAFEMYEQDTEDARGAAEGFIGTLIKDCLGENWWDESQELYVLASSINYN